MDKKEAVILYDSPEAASIKTGLSGWVSSNGRYWGKDEHMARWDGCTHRKCQDCGAVHEKNWAYCPECYKKKRHEQFLSLPEVPFDKVECCKIWDDDTFFFSPEEDISEYCLNNDIDPADLCLEVCEAKIELSKVGEDYWADELPEDHDLPPKIEEALNALNKAIKEHSPTVWWGCNKRTTYKELA